MPKVFLGKNIPEPKLPNVKLAGTKLKRLRWLWLFPLLLSIAWPVQALVKNYVFSNSQQAAVQSAYNNGESTRVLAVIANPCDSNLINPLINNMKIFPLVPSELVSNNANECSPPYWNLLVVLYFAYKALRLVNGIAYIMAVTFTVIAGLYYIAGFANEANIKKGKSILLATYIGLIIVLSARLILYGTYQVITGRPVNPNNISSPAVTLPPD